jgi:hypothetical protein
MQAVSRASQLCSYLYFRTSKASKLSKPHSLLSLLALQLDSSTCAGDFCVQGRRGDCVAAQPQIAGRASATAGLRQYSSSSLFVRAAASVFVLLY